MTHAAPLDARKTSGRATSDTHHRAVPGVLAGAGFLVLALSFMVNAMDRQVFPPLLPGIRAEYGFSLQAGGLLATGFTLGMAFAGLPSGYLVDRFSRKTVLLVSIVIYSLGTLATPLASGFADMAVYRIVSGLGEGMQAAALFTAIGAYFHHRRGLALGALGVAFGVGVFLGPLIGVNLASAHGTWRAPFIVFGTAGLLMAAIAALTVRRGLTERSVERTTAAQEYDHMPASPYNRNTIALAVSSAISGVVLYGFIGLYPTFLISNLHFTSAQAALAMSFVGFGGMTGIVGGWLGDRVDQRNLLIVSHLALAASSLLVYQTHLTIGWQCLFAFLMGAFGTGFLFPNTNSAMQRAVRPSQVGRGAGLFISSYYVTAAFSGLIFAALVDGFGWHLAGLWQITLLPLIAVAALTFVRTSEFSNAVR
ncbi:MFS transporter [Spirillospora sp. CA-142024]|uniref:MFS transporter n=1 Tax=Spirillospora sp. CA-142024 TaxID=3240036 RepID=UPI003D931CE4